MNMLRRLSGSVAVVWVIICVSCAGGGNTTARFYNLGMSAYLSKQYLKSIEYLESVLEKNPSDHRSLYLLGLDYAALGDQDRAIDFLERAVAFEGREVQYRAALGVLYHNKGKADAARQSFLAAQKISPDDPSIEVLLGRLDLEQGDEKSAGAHFERALTLQPQHPEAGDLLKSLGIAVTTEPKGEKAY